MKRILSYKLTQLFSIVFLCLHTHTDGRPPAIDSEPRLIHAALVHRLFEMRPGWQSDPIAGPVIRQRFLQVLDSALYAGLEKEKYHYAQLKTGADNKLIFADAVIAYAKDLYAGHPTGWISNDEISEDYEAPDDSTVVARVAAIQSIGDLNNALASLEPADVVYNSLKRELSNQIESGHEQAITRLNACLALYRWIHHFHFSQVIVINIPSATLNYYEDGTEKLAMKVVVGAVRTRTPSFSTYCTEVILYPYWHVPQSIARKELIPKFAKNPAAVDAMNMSVISRNGQTIDHSGINWAGYKGQVFPYTLRQGTGCDNPLGVIKFNLTDPFDVYLHDTNFKKAFEKTNRFLSHGCIRLEKPIELANYLLEEKPDTNLIKACLKDQKPIVTKLPKPVPVFVVYMPATADENGNVVFHKDIYRLFK